MPRVPFAAVACSLFLSLGLGGCAYDDGYGYGGVDVGYGYGGYYGPDYYGPAGYYGGWYDGYYYPGSGYYVYDRGGSRYRWNDRQRSYWENRHRSHRDDRDGRPRDGWPNNDWQGRRDDGNRYDRDRNRDDRRPAWNGQQPGDGTIRSRQDWEANRQRQWREQNQGAVQRPAPSADREGWDAARGAVMNRPTPNLRQESRPEQPRGDRGRGDGADRRDSGRRDWGRGVRKAAGTPDRGGQENGN